MKKNLLLVLTAVLFSCIFISCDKDEDTSNRIPTDKDLVGEWLYTDNVITKINDQKVNINISEIIEVDEYSVIFKADNTIGFSDDMDLNEDVQYWRLKEEGTILEIYLKNSEGLENSNYDLNIFLNSTTFKLIITDIYENSDLSENGMFSFADFDKLHNTKITGLDEIDVIVENVYTKVK